MHPTGDRLRACTCRRAQLLWPSLTRCTRFAAGASDGRLNPEAVGFREIELTHPTPRGGPRGMNRGTNEAHGGARLAGGVHEILPGVFHWLVPPQQIRVDGSPYSFSP